LVVFLPFTDTIPDPIQRSNFNYDSDARFGRDLVRDGIDVWAGHLKGHLAEAAIAAAATLSAPSIASSSISSAPPSLSNHPIESPLALPINALSTAPTIPELYVASHPQRGFDISRFRRFFGPRRDRWVHRRPVLQILHFPLYRGRYQRWVLSLFFRSRPPRRRNHGSLPPTVTPPTPNLSFSSYAII
jgi:hypothetical protein